MVGFDLVLQIVTYHECLFFLFYLNSFILFKVKLEI